MNQLVKKFGKIQRSEDKMGVGEGKNPSLWKFLKKGASQLIAGFEIL